MELHLNPFYTQGEEWERLDCLWICTKSGKRYRLVKEGGGVMATAKLTVPILVDMDSTRDYLAQHDVVEVVRCENCRHWGDPISTITPIYCECKP